MNDPPRRQRGVILRAGSRADRLVLGLNALLQLVVSSLLLFAEFVAYGGGFQLARTPFLLFGFVNSFFLFTARPIPRVGAFLWQSIFVIWALISLFIYPINLANPSNQFLGVIDLLMLIFLIYLAASIRYELAKHSGNWSAWLRSE